MATSNKKAQSGGKKSSLWLILLIVIALAATAGAGAGWWFLNHKKTETASSEPPPPPAPVFMPLDTFTVNLLSPDNNPDRVLYVGITLRLPDEATRARLTNYLPEIRSRLIMLFSRQSSSVLATEQGKQKLVEDIKQVLSPPLVPGQPSQVVSDVLFTAFILR